MGEIEDIEIFEECPHHGSHSVKRGGIMVIDKTTGRGCALGMVSKTIAGKLVSEGIIGKTIYRKHRKNSKNSYDLFRAVKYREEVYVYRRKVKNWRRTRCGLLLPLILEYGRRRSASS